MKSLEPYKNCFAHRNAIYISTADASQKPCCYFKGGANAKTYQEYKDTISKIDIAKACSHCIEIEDGGATWSHRLQYEQDFYLQNGKIFVIGVCFDNICNIKCTTCGPANSSKWIEDYSKLNLWPSKEEKRKYVRMTLQAPEKVKFIQDIIKNQSFDLIRFDIFGGEPAINPKIIEFLDWLATTEITHKVMINVTTNVTTFFSNLMNYINKFKNIHIQMSIDGINDHYNYLRYGADWETVSKNIIEYDKLAQDYDNVFPSIHYTLSWMNSLHFVDFYKWASENTNNLVGLHLTKVVSPTFYSVDLLTPIRKNEVIKVANNLLQQVDLSHLNERQISNFQHIKEVYFTNMENYVTNLYENSTVKMNALDTLKKLDMIRSTDYKQTFKEILKFYD